MHALLILSSLPLAVLVGWLALFVLIRVDGWPRRRQLQLAVLLAPVVSLGVSLGGLHYFLGRICFLRTFSWDYMAGTVLPVGMGLVALGGFGLGVVRLAVMSMVLGRRGGPAGAEVQRTAEHLARRLGAPRPRVMICSADRPVALTFGFRHPTVLLSDWMVRRLDVRELESVLAHEVGHVTRRDSLVTWFATVLRDAFFYLPTSLAAYRQFQFERELACDDVAVAATGRPLALASALAKVWQHALDGSAPEPALAFAAPDYAIEQRIERLLGRVSGSRVAERSWRFLSPTVRSLPGIATLLAANAAIMLAPMGCGPGALLWRL
ncbi:MAG: M56 family metallopeptidase [Armatimonadota bacterium]